MPAAETERVLGKAIEREHSLADLLRRPNISYAALMSLDQGRFAPQTPLGDIEVEQIEIMAKYAGYIDRQHDEVERASHFEKLKLPPDLDYMQVHALSYEVRQKLTRHKPETLGMASRLSGMTPAAMSLLMVHLRKGGHKGFHRVPEAAVEVHNSATP